MTYVQNKSLDKDKKLELYAPRGICRICRVFQNCRCNVVLICGSNCELCQLNLQDLQKYECEKEAVYKLLRRGMVGGPAQVFTQYHEKYVTRIRSYVSGEESKLT